MQIWSALVLATSCSLVLSGCNTSTQFNDPDKRACITSAVIAEQASREESNACFDRAKTMRFRDQASQARYFAGCTKFGSQADEMAAIKGELMSTLGVSFAVPVDEIDDALSAMKNDSGLIAEAAEKARTCSKAFMSDSTSPKTDIEPQILLDRIDFDERMAEFKRSPEKQIAEHTNCIGYAARDVIDETYDSFPDRQALSLESVLASLPEQSATCETPSQCTFMAHFDRQIELQQGLVSGRLISQTLTPEDATKLAVTPRPEAIQQAAFDWMGDGFSSERLAYLKSVPSQTFKHNRQKDLCALIADEAIE